MTDELRPGPKRYRIRAYDNDYEVMPNRNHLTVLDLDSPHGMRAAERELEAIRIALAALVDVGEEALHTFRLAVHAWPDGAYVMDWSARS
jgi:hypothetical protein